MKNALIINAHQRWENFAEGKLNQSFASVAEDRLTMFCNFGFRYLYIRQHGPCLPGVVI